MVDSNAQLMNLPDELLLIILKKLDSINVLCSLMGLNTHLDEIICDPCFTTEINLIKPNDDQTSGQVETWIDQLRQRVLPAIHRRVRWLKVESTWLERLLVVGDYPSLSQLDIFIPNEEPILPFSGESTLIWLSSSMTVQRTTELELRMRNEDEIDFEFNSFSLDYRVDDTQSEA